MKSIVKYEWLQIKRNKISAILLTVICLLLLLSLVMSWSYYNWYNKQQQQVSENARHHWETQGEKNSHSAAHFGINLFKPLSPLAIWDNGVDKHYGVNLFVEAHARNQLQFKAIEDNPLLARWGELTPARVLLVLLPLLLIWLAGNSIVNDRMNGTLKLMVTQGTAVRKLLWAKALALWCMSAVIITGIWLAGGILASFLSGQSFFTTPSLLLWILYNLYAGIFIHIGLLVSLLVKSRRSALVTVLGIWLLTVWLVPRVFVQLSEKQFPAIYTETFLEKIKADVALHGLNSHGKSGNREKELEQQWLAKYGVDSLQQLPINWLGVLLQADEETNNPIYDKHYDSLYAVYDKQLAIHRWSGWFSPFMPAQLASMSFAGTDLKNSEHFYAQTERYRKIFIKKLNDHLRDNSLYGGRDLGREDYWKAAPLFEYKPTDRKDRWKWAEGAFLTVALWLLLLLLATHLISGRIKNLSTYMT